MKGNLPSQAIASFREALQLSPIIWEAYEGLCALGTLIIFCVGVRPDTYLKESFRR